MKQLEFNILGKVDNDGKLLIANKAEMNDFFARNPGSKVIMTANLIQKQGSNSIIGYYNLKIVPDFQRLFREIDGERYTLQQTDLKLREMSHVMQVEIPDHEANGFRLVRLKSIYECNNIEIVEFIDQLRMIAGSRYDYFIEDPKKEFSQLNKQ